MIMQKNVKNEQQKIRNSAEKKTWSIFRMLTD